MADLVAKAREEFPHKGVREPDEERLQLALLVLSGEISLRQAARAMGVTETNVGARLWAHVYRASLRGLIRVRRASRPTEVSA